MPNRYSHASVLSYYDSRGFISYPDQSRSSPSPPASILSFDLDKAYDADHSATPPLTAVPALCDASTNSTNSSFETVPSKPLHSASSSIVTEIYAPGSPVQPPYIESVLPTRTAPEESKSINHSKPPDVQPEEEPSFQNPYFQSNLRYSSAQYFPALCNQSRPLKKQKIPPDDQRVCTPTEPTSKSSIPRNTSTRTHTSLQSVTDRTPQDPKIPYKRIQPTFSIESLPPLEFLSCDDDVMEDDGPPSPDADVLPWEYSEDVVPWEYPDNGVPYAHRYSVEFGGDQSPQLEATADREKGKESENDSGYQSSFEDGRPSERIPSSTNNKSSTELHIPSSSQPSTSPPYPAADAFPAPPSFIPPPSPSHSYSPSHPHHHQYKHHLSIPRRSRSINSFDSAAPPPIRFHAVSSSKPLDAMRMNMKLKGHSPAYGEWMGRAGGGGTGADWVRTGRRR